MVVTPSGRAQGHHSTETKHRESNRTADTLLQHRVLSSGEVGSLLKNGTLAAYDALPLAMGKHPDAVVTHAGKNVPSLGSEHLGMVVAGKAVRYVDDSRTQTQLVLQLMSRDVLFGLNQDSVLAHGRGPRVMADVQDTLLSHAHSLDAVPVHVKGQGVSAATRAWMLNQGLVRSAPSVLAADQHSKPYVNHSVRFSPTHKAPVFLIGLPPIAGKEVTGFLWKFPDLECTLGPKALRSVVAQLGPLTLDEFKAVHAELGGCSHVHYDPTRNYSVKDFFPPALQALLEMDFEVPEDTLLPGSVTLVQETNRSPGDLTVRLSTNCHGTTYEAMRAYQGMDDSVALFQGEMILLDELTQDPNRFQVVGEVDKSHIEELKKLAMNPGDAVLFFEQDSGRETSTSLVHSATYVGGGLYFEKPDTEGLAAVAGSGIELPDETPYRLADFETLTDTIADRFDAYRVAVVRPTSTLEDPTRIFRSELTEMLPAWAKKQGRNIGVELVPEIEQGSTGAVLGQYANALVRVKLVTQPDGTSSLDPAVIRSKGS